ncbi:MAG TPA: PP2C family serine/threonine-protein phosphatase, partial [Saprospiraceae bacterium]|nr:PP2C family serine/threonine-protein phosphatase [Saprospiraceae bacterium]
KIDNLATGNFILLVTDGVGEAFDHEELINILLDTQLISIHQKMDLIKQRCLKISRDNSTCVLIEN